MGQLILLLLGGIALFAGGAGLGYWLTTFSRERKRADALQQDLDQYRDQVNQHFAQTAEHFRTIGREYRALYDHMASGAETLCDPQAAATGRLSFAPPPPDSAAQTAETTGRPPADETATVSAEASDEEDGMTPDQRARGLGGESAPSEDDGAQPEVVPIEATADLPPGAEPDASAEPTSDAEPKAAEEPAEEPATVAADPAEAPDSEREHTLH